MTGPGIEIRQRKSAASACEAPSSAKRATARIGDNPVRLSFNPGSLALEHPLPSIAYSMVFSRLLMKRSCQGGQILHTPLCRGARRVTSTRFGNKLPRSREQLMTGAEKSLGTGSARDWRFAHPSNMTRRTQQDSYERENRMEHKSFSRMATLVALIALVAALMTATAARPAEAIPFYHGACSVSAGNGYYSYYWAATTSSDADCTRVGVAWHTGSMSYDNSYPFSIDKSSATHPAGAQSWHYLKNSVSSTTKYLQYTW